MKGNLAQELNLLWEPVGIFFADKKPTEAIEFPTDKRVCVVSMIRASINGKIVVVSDETCRCPGGAVGLCFGDAFTRRNHKTTQLLSTGMGLESSPKLPDHFKHGERFFASPEIAQRWKESLPYTETQSLYRVFAPLSKCKEDNPPDLVYLFANPDQISALVIMSGFYRGTALNVIAPFASACQSILFAYQELKEQQPKAIMGGFDLSQRHRFPKDLLTLTMPHCMFKEIESGINEGCLTTEAWKKIARRG